MALVFGEDDRVLAIVPVTIGGDATPSPSGEHRVERIGSSSLDFELRFWIADPRNGLTNPRGQIRLAPWDAFKQGGIAIASPRREIIMRIPVEIRRMAPLD